MGTLNEKVNIYSGDEEKLVANQICGDLSMLIDLEDALKSTALPISLQITESGHNVTMIVTNSYFRTLSDTQFIGFPVLNAPEAMTGILNILPHLRHDSRMIVLRELHRRLQERWVLLAKMVTAQQDFASQWCRIGQIVAPLASSRSIFIRISESIGTDRTSLAWSHIHLEAQLPGWLKFMQAATLVLEMYEELKTRVVQD
jgi:hypothetical protein